MKRGLTRSLTVLAVAALARVAAAEPHRASLVVTRGEGAEDCPDAVALVERVRGMTGDDALHVDAGDGRAATWVSVELSRTSSGYRALLVARGARHGTRSIEDVGPGCRSLAGALAITLVMLLDPEAQREPEPLPPVPRRPASAPQPIARPPAEPAPRRAPEQPADEPPVLGLEAHAGGTVAVLEHAVPFVRGGARVRWGRGVVGAGAAYVKPDRVTAPGGAVELRLWFAYLGACARLTGSRETAVRACVESMAGSLGGEGDAYETFTDQRRLPWIAAAGGVELDAGIARSFRWSARAVALAPLVRQAFRVRVGETSSTAFRTPLAGGLLTLGLVWEP